MLSNCLLCHWLFKSNDHVVFCRHIALKYDIFSPRSLAKISRNTHKPTKTTEGSYTSLVIHLALHRPAPIRPGARPGRASELAGAGGSRNEEFYETCHAFLDVLLTEDLSPASLETTCLTVCPGR